MLRCDTRIEEHQLEETNKTAASVFGPSATRPVDTETQLEPSTRDLIATTPPDSDRKRRPNELKDDRRLEEDSDQQGEMPDQMDSTGSTNRIRLSQKESTLRSPSTKKARHTNIDTKSTLALSTILNNPTDPCRVLPTEVWHQILSFLRPSGIARISVVSKAWLDGCRSHPVWRSACEKGGLGELNDLYKSCMALVCANSFWVCEACLSISKGHPRLSHIPLQARLPGYYNFDTNNHSIDGDGRDYDAWRLCHEYRLKYHGSSCLSSNPYGLLPLSTTVLLVEFVALAQYYMTRDDLRSMAGSTLLEGGSSNAESYLHSHVRARALKIHGGWVGIEAIRRGIALKRDEQFEKRRVRDRAFLIDQEIQVERVPADVTLEGVDDECELETGIEVEI
ncbi:hypothetical protein BGX29_011700 [Mortierella sp. GBA35]|nr:hypothetical protein BGX29_011700 [Mortierella sp. GBA35]